MTNPTGDALLARIKELEEALQPFADYWARVALGKMDKSDNINLRTWEKAYEVLNK